LKGSDYAVRATMGQPPAGGGITTRLPGTVTQRHLGTIT